jgi:hypothetical protein
VQARDSKSQGWQISPFAAGQQSLSVKGSNKAELVHNECTTLMHLNLVSTTAFSIVGGG